MTALHVFDLDGTLLRGTTASRQIAAAHGSHDQLHVLEGRFGRSDINTRQFAAAIHALWSDLDPATVAAAFTGGAWMNGIAEVCSATALSARPVPLCRLR